MFNWALFIALAICPNQLNSCIPILPDPLATKIVKLPTTPKSAQMDAFLYETSQKKCTTCGTTTKPVRVKPVLTTTPGATTVTTTTAPTTTKAPDCTTTTAPTTTKAPDCTTCSQDILTDPMLANVHCASTGSTVNGCATLQIFCENMGCETAELYIRSESGVVTRTGSSTGNETDTELRCQADGVWQDGAAQRGVEVTLKLVTPC
ncbi:DUF281 domain-containing protein [Caenorhabditis elegans]|uniref:DUF281 domain-containing protein n=1 Tax=Caenorhabditis elegans TaxID=6239 RepID=O44855_CAEEL|nr:DUF281 domain-containing protein [Caenorhabditis elegans]CCD73589.1 DUF281 domain-containing protein [Caenorhabditis elegans]|eukprot:NP_494345.2 Uncharacterized protein CELE_T05A8.6 [Caenorhabditis elegans]